MEPTYQESIDSTLSKIRKINKLKNQLKPKNRRYL